MKKQIIIALITALLAVAGVAAAGSARLGVVEFAGWIGNDAVFHYNVYGTGDHDAKNARATFWFPEADVYGKTYPFSIRDNGPDGKFAYVPMGKTRLAPGLHHVRVTLTSDKIRDDRWVVFHVR